MASEVVISSDGADSDGPTALLGVTVAGTPVAESTRATNARDGCFLGGRYVLLFLVFLFIHTHELTAHARFFCRATNIAMLLHDARVHLSILKTWTPTASTSCMRAMHHEKCDEWLRTPPWLTSLFAKTKLNIVTIKTNRSTNNLPLLLFLDRGNLDDANLLLKLMKTLCLQHLR
jgi:hypothetical protein